ncbi:MAG: hypothetical protein HC860_12855 [Alkalinema sp. RU_4_3]|nr:hypothetical protein [Alkalinema sp. RU_4_3]
MKRLFLGLLLVAVSLPIVSKPAIAQLKQADIDGMVDAAIPAIKPGESADEYVKRTTANSNELEEQKEAYTRHSIEPDVRRALREGKPQKALERLTDYRQLNPNSYYDLGLSGWIKEAYLGDLKGAWADYDQAVTKAKAALKAEESAGARATKIAKHKGAIAENTQNQVSLLFITANPKQADQILKQTAEMIQFAESNEKNWTALLNRARHHELLVTSRAVTGKYTKAQFTKTATEAKELFDTAVSLQPKVASGYFYRGLFRARVLEDASGAKEDIKQAYRLAKESGDKLIIDRSTEALKSIGEKP